MKGIAVILFFIFLQARAMKFETARVSGTGCEAYANAEVKSEGGKFYKFPLQLSIFKKEDSQLERKVCQLALPIKLNKKEKLQVANLSQNVNLKAFGGAYVKLSLSVSAVGPSSAVSKPLEIEVKNPTQLDQDLKQDGLMFETQCGKDTILRANVNAFTQGSGTASANTGDLLLSLKAVPCTK